MGFKYIITMLISIIFAASCEESDFSEEKKLKAKKAEQERVSIEKATNEIILELGKNIPQL